jgi:heme a synthase
LVEAASHQARRIGHHEVNGIALKTATKTLGVITTLGMFLVLIMGSVVTNTGSEHGCGRSWPLCHGQFIPRFAFTTAVEFSHRAVVGVVTPLIILLAIAALYLYRDRREIQILAPVMVVFLFLQAGLGAWAVMAPTVAAVLALHFGVSLIDFASVLLTTIFLFEADAPTEWRDHPIPAAFRRGIWLTTGYSYLVVYLGAYVRHTNADDACTGWPLCSGTVLPSLGSKVVSNVGHRIAAGLLVLAIASLVVWAWRLRENRPDLFRGAVLALGAVLLQAAAGAMVEFTDMDLFSALAHAALAGLLFGSLTYLCMRIVPLPSEYGVRMARRAPARPPAGAAR